MIDSEQVTLNQSEAKNVGRDLLNRKAAIKMRLGGYSMYPNLLPDDIATIEHIEPASLKLGQVIVVEIENRWIAHRLIWIAHRDGQVLIRTQGDSVYKVDDVITSKQLIGVVSVVHRKGEELKLNQKMLRYVYTKPVLQFVNGISLKFWRFFN
jgi:hypothetical protein